MKTIRLFKPRRQDGTLRRADERRPGLSPFGAPLNALRPLIS